MLVIQLLVNFETSKQKLDGLAMAKTRYTFEKREREKAKRQKRMDKLAQRQTAKKVNADTGSEITAEEANSTGLSAVSHPSDEAVINKHSQ